MTPENLAIARNLPEMDSVVSHFMGWDLKDMRLVNRNGSSILVKIANGKTRREFRVSVQRMAGPDLSLTVASVCPLWEFSTSFFRIFRSEMFDATVKYQVQSRNDDGMQVMFAILCERLPKIQTWFDRAKALAMGEGLRRERAHHRISAMKDAENALARAFAKGATKQEVDDMVEMLLVQGVLER